MPLATALLLIAALNLAEPPSAPTGEGSTAPAAQPAPAAPASAPPPTPAPTAPTAPRPDDYPEIILYLKDGTFFQGLLIVEDKEHFLIEIAGVNASFAASKVDRVRILPPVLERYKEMRAATGEHDLEQRIRIIRWLADRKREELALAEAELLLQKNPKHVGARKLADDLRARVDLLVKAPQPGEPRPQPAPDEPAPADDRAIPPREFPFLTDAQIAMLKVYEIDLATRPRVVFAREDVARMIDDHAANPLIPASREGKDAILRQDPLKNVELMFRLRARDFYQKVRVIDQPESMRRFRDDVQRVTLMTGCATTQCHGGRDAGRLVLSTYRPNTDTNLYTNFYILTKFQTSAGLPLINWDNPEQSVLLQVALPTEVSRFRHPTVMKDGKNVWRPALTGPEDIRAKSIVNWIASAYRPRPDYTLDYTPYRPFVAPPPPAPADVRDKANEPAEPVIR